MNIRFDGLDEIMDKLARLGRFADLAEPIMQGIGEDIRSEVSPYPPPSEANQPRPGGWYQRGYGPRWFSGGRASSQQLGQKWFVRPGKLFVDIGNMATYARYVHGDQQAWFHAPRGWKKLRESAEALRPRIVEGLKGYIQRLLRT